MIVKAGYCLAGWVYLTTFGWMLREIYVIFLHRELKFIH